MQFNWGLRVTEKKLYITSNFKIFQYNLTGNYVSDEKNVK